MKNDFPNGQLSFFQRPIESVEINPNGLDELGLTLLGVQEIYKNTSLRIQILTLIRNDLEQEKISKVGPKGFSIWEIFVLLMVRRTGTVDYNKLSDLAENHLILREILGHGLDKKIRYPVSTLHDNITSIKPATIDKINEIIVKHGHTLCKGSLEKVRTDSFVFESNIHLHADYKSLVDGVRCLMREGNRLSKLIEHSGFRKWKKITRESKNLGYKIVQLKRSNRKNKEDDLRDAYLKILNHTDRVMSKVLNLLEEATTVDYEANDKDSEKEKKEKEKKKKLRDKLYSKIVFFASGTCIEHELTNRRNILGETIPSKEKIFSLFEPHTEIIIKGKAGKFAEYGHLVFVAQDKSGFMLTGTRVESGERDKDICISETKKLQKMFDTKIEHISFDKGFYTPLNKKLIQELVASNYLPPKGGNANKEKTKEFYKEKNWHSGVESSINAIEQGNNMGVCRDKGLAGFDRCIAASIAARNLHTLGKIKAKELRKKAKKKSALAA